MLHLTLKILGTAWLGRGKTWEELATILMIWSVAGNGQNKVDKKLNMDWKNQDTARRGHGFVWEGRNTYWKSHRQSELMMGNNKQERSTDREGMDGCHWG